jgi:NADH:ubiquinone oxidoreductase subunit K
MTPLAGCLLVSALLFSIGLAGALTRRSAILVLAGIELMLNAANLNFIAFWRYGAQLRLPSAIAGTLPAQSPDALTGVIFVVFSIAVAAAEAAVGLALILAIYRHQRTSDVSEITEMKG